MSEKVTSKLAKAADATAYETFRGILEDSFVVDGFRGVMQVCRAVSDAYDAALAVCAENGFPDSLSLAVAATQLNRSALPELRRAVAACLGTKGMS